MIKWTKENLDALKTFGPRSAFTLGFCAAIAVLVASLQSDWAVGQAGGLLGFLPENRIAAFEQTKTELEQAERKLAEASMVANAWKDYGEQQRARADTLAENYAQLEKSASGLFVQIQTMQTRINDFEAKAATPQKRLIYLNPGSRVLYAEASLIGDGIAGVTNDLICFFKLNDSSFRMRKNQTVLVTIGHTNIRIVTRQVQAEFCELELTPLQS